MELTSTSTNMPPLNIVFPSIAHMPSDIGFLLRAFMQPLSPIIVAYRQLFGKRILFVAYIPTGI